MVSFSGCAAPLKWPAEVNKYVLVWEKTYSRINTSPIALTPIADPEIAGYCYGDGHIELDLEYWNTDTTDEMKLALVFHELGHCQLGYSHSAGISGYDGCPWTFMYPYVMSTRCWKLRYPDITL